MAVPAKIGVVISANIKSLQTNLSAATNALNGFSQKVNAIGGLVTGAIGTFAAFKTAQFVNGVMESIDSIAKLSSALGISADKLAGYEHAANLSGVSTEQLRAGINRLARQGLTLEDVADQMAALETPTERAQLAVKLLGRGGQALIPMLQGGRDALRQMVDEGIRLSGLKGMNVAQIEAANDAMTRVKAAIDGVVRMFLITLAPVIENVATGFVNSFMEVQTTFAAIVWTIEFGMNNFSRIAELAWTKFQLSAVTTANIVTHFFTETIPELLRWFSQNWFAVFETTYNFASSVFTNLVKNIRSLFVKLWEWVKSGFQGSFEVDWTPLTQGFVNTIRELPNIPKREMSALERELTSKVSMLGEGLASDFAKHVEQRSEEMFGEAQKIRPDRLQIEDSQGRVAGRMDAIGGVKGVLQGTSEAWSAIMEAMRTASGPNELVSLNQQQLKEQVAQTKLLREMAQGDIVELVPGDV
jgi:hypothetical protein